ncbi:MAG TPA: rRNA maturation RNase YbeY [Bacillota bacterium]|nr:rRNA maturation RNase YbeY [Bacillota bacterium]HOA14831.1 rRNA maturation RNase YbeY [Bacillota bacterium]
MHEVIVDTAFEGEVPSPADEKAASLAQEAIRSCVGMFAEEGSYEVSVLITDDVGIRKLNKSYRGKDSSTDVLSFPQWEDGLADGDPGEVSLLGDIVISLETARRQAADFGHTVEREVAYLAVHGTLHLLGYDHEDEADKAEMRLAEEEVLKALGQGR